MVDDRLAGYDDLESAPYRCPGCGHTKNSLTAIPCPKCGVEMEPQQA